MKLQREHGEAITEIYRVLLRLHVPAEKALKRAKLAVLGEGPKPAPKPQEEKPWHCCGVPVRTVGLSVQCQGACGRTSR